MMEGIQLEVLRAAMVSVSTESPCPKCGSKSKLAPVIEESTHSVIAKGCCISYETACRDSAIKKILDLPA